MGVGVQRVFVDRVAGGDLNDPAEDHHGDAVADVADHRQAVGDEQIGQAQALLQLDKHDDDLGLARRQVKHRDRLVTDDYGRLQGQCPGDADSLALAAGELVRLAVGHVGQQADGAHSSAMRSA